MDQMCPVMTGSYEGLFIEYRWNVSPTVLTLTGPNSRKLASASEPYCKF
jgi:hypothetical protein